MHDLVNDLFASRPIRCILDNGLTVLLQEKSTVSLVSCQLWVKAGSMHEDHLLGAGVSHCLEHMLFKGTERRNYNSINREVQAVGGSMNAYTSFDRTVYHIDGPSESLLTFIDVLADIIFHSNLPAEEVEKERSVIQREIDMGEDDPDRQLTQAVFNTVYRVHPYRYPVIGSRSLFDRLTREDLLHYYRRRYVPSNMCLVITGAIDVNGCKNDVEKVFGRISSRPLAPVYIASEPLQLTRREALIWGDYQIIRGAWAYRIPGLCHKDAPALAALAAILGGGQSSCLWQYLREEKKWVHDIAASAWLPSGDTGLLWITYQCDIGDECAVEGAILDVVEQQLLQSLAPKLLDKVVRRAIVGEINQCKTISGQAARIGMAEVVAGDLNYPKRNLEYLQNLSVDTIYSVARRYLISDYLTTVRLSPVSSRCELTTSATQAVDLFNFEELTLSNGARLLFQPAEHFPKVSLRALFLGGAFYEKADQRGSTALLATLLVKDTLKRTAKEIAEAVEDIGGTFAETAGNNAIGIGLEVLPQDITLAVDLLKEALLQPKFSKKTFLMECEAQIAAIKEEQDEVVEYGRRWLRAKFFGDHPYHVDSLGTMESLEMLSVSDIEALYRTLIVGPNTVVVAVGKFDRDELANQLCPLLESLPETPLNIVDQPFVGPLEPGAYTLSIDRTQAVVYQAYPSIGITSDIYFVSEVLAELFGGMASQLITRVREELGLAYYIGVDRMVGLTTGMLCFYGGTSPEQHTAVLKEIDQDIERIQAGAIGVDELQRCKAYLKAQKRSGLQSIGARSLEAGLRRLYGLPSNYWQMYDEKIDAVTAAHLQSFAQVYLDRKKRVQLVINPQRFGQG